MRLVSMQMTPALQTANKALRSMSEQGSRFLKRSRPHLFWAGYIRLIYAWNSLGGVLPIHPAGSMARRCVNHERLSFLYHSPYFLLYLILGHARAVCIANSSMRNIRKQILCIPRVQYQNNLTWSKCSQSYHDMDMARWYIDMIRYDLIR
jgi:hypothetical protein